MKRRTPDRTADDRELWHQVTRRITPLPGKRAPVPPATSVSKDLPVRPRAPVAPPSPHAPLPSLRTDTTAGIDAATLRRFRAGKMPVEATLDLHGLTQAAAHQALSRFVLTGYHQGRRCVLVVTGKGARSDNPEGRGVLRRALPLWLEAPDLRPCLLAIASARPNHGGTGACYLLLRRKRTLEKDARKTP